MPTVLKVYDFAGTGGGRPARDWTPYFDGQIYKFTRGVDFNCKVTSFRQAVYKAAGKHGYDVRVSTVDEDTAVVQFLPKPKVHRRATPKKAAPKKAAAK